MTYTKTQKFLLSLLPFGEYRQLATQELDRNIRYFGNRYATNELKKYIKSCFNFITYGNVNGKEYRLISERCGLYYVRFGYTQERFCYYGEALNAVSEIKGNVNLLPRYQ